MSVLQKVRLIAGERLDVPDIQRIQEFTCADFGQFFNKFWSDTPRIVKGFEISDPYSYISALTSQGIQVDIANSVMYYGNSSFGGAFFVAPPDAEIQAVALTANSINYIEMEMTVSTGTPDTRKIWDADRKVEFDQIIDTVQYLDVIVAANTIGFTAGRIPIAKVVTNGASPSAITSITDCRELVFRLGSGGSNPNQYYNFNWPDVPAGYSRTDQPITVSGTSPAGTNPFKGSDKNIRNLKEWMDAIMTRIKEISGNPFWFTTGGGGGGTANVADLWWDSIGSKMTGTGTFTHAPAGTLTWSSDILVQGIVGPYYFKIPAGSVTLADDEIAYLQQVRNQSLPNPVIFINGSSVVDSVSGLPGDFTLLQLNDWVKNIIDGIECYAQVLDFKAALGGLGASTTPALALSIIISPAYIGTSSTLSGTVGHYAKGTYDPGAFIPEVVVAARSAVPNNSDIWWLAIREDNGGINPLIYIRDGSELEVNESIEIGDETSDQVLSYIGAPNEATPAPAYSTDATDSLLGQTDYNAFSSDDLTVRLSKATSMIADKAQDKNIKIREGGLFTWDLGTDTLSWSGNIIVSIPSSTNNNVILAGSVVIPVAGQVARFSIDRNALINPTLVVETEDIVPLDEKTFVLAYRGADNNIYLMDGTVIVDGTPSMLGLGSYLFYRVGTDIMNANAGDSLSIDADLTAGGNLNIGGQGIFADHLYAYKNLYVGNWIHIDAAVAGGGTFASDDSLDIILDQQDAFANSHFRIMSGSLDSKDSLGEYMFQYSWALPYDIWSIDEAGAQRNYGSIEVGTPALHAAGTMTFSLLPSIGETFVINGQTHTLVASASGANQITLSSVSAAEQGDFVARDFNLWSAQATNCLAVSDGTGNVKFIWKIAGAAGNIVIFTEAMSNCTVDGAGFLGGTSAGVDAVINGTWLPNGDITVRDIIARNIDASDTIFGTDIKSRKTPIYNANLWGALDDNGVTDNSGPLSDIIDDILASNVLDAVIWFPTGFGPSNYYEFQTPVIKDLAGAQILITGNAVGKGSMQSLMTAFRFNTPTANCWEFSNGPVSLDSILFVGDGYGAADVTGIKMTNGGGGFIHNCFFSLNYIHSLVMTGCNHWHFDLNVFNGGPNTSGKILDLQQCNWIDINNSYSGGYPAAPGTNMGINIGLSCSNITIDNLYAFNFPAGAINIQDLSKVIALRNLNIFATVGETCKGVLIDKASDIVIDNYLANLLDTYDIELYNRPVNVTIRNYRTEKAGYTGINDTTGITLLGNSTDQPCQFPYVKGIDNRDANLVVGVGGVKAIGKLVFTGLSIVTETLTINGTAHTYVAAVTANPDEIRVGTTIALSASRTALYFNRNSTERDKVWAWADGVDTVYFYAKDPGVAANAYTFTTTLSNANIPAATGFMNNQQVGVDPIDKFLVDYTNGNVTTPGTVDGVDVSTHDHSTSSAQTRLASKDRRRFAESEKHAADGAAADVLSEHMVLQAQDALTITKCFFLPDAALTADDTNYATLIVYRRDASGGTQAVIASMTTQITGGSGNWTAFDGVDLGTLTNTAISAGQVVTIEITKAAAGVIVPSGTWQIEYTVD